MIDVYDTNNAFSDDENIAYIIQLRKTHWDFFIPVNIEPIINMIRFSLFTRLLKWTQSSALDYSTPKSPISISYISIKVCYWIIIIYHSSHDDNGDRIENGHVLSDTKPEVWKV